MLPGFMVKILVNRAKETFSLSGKKTLPGFNEESDRTRFACHTWSPSNELNAAVISPGRWQ